MRKSAGILAAAMTFIMVSGIGTAAFADETSEKYVIANDGEYSYSYDDNGLCIKAESGSQTLEFRYDLDDAGRPSVRYITEDGSERVYETYEYDENGNLTKLLVYTGSEEPVTWYYDENGRAQYVENLTSETDDPAESAGYYFLWDDEGKLIERKYPSAIAPVDRESIVEMILEKNKKVSTMEEAEAKFDSYLEKYDCETWADGDYLMQIVDEVYEYDDEGRIIRIEINNIRYPLSAIVIGAKMEDTTVNTSIIELAYTGDEQIDYYFYSIDESGNPIDRDDSHRTIYVSMNDKGLPKGLSTSTVKTEANLDIYENLSFEVESARVGFFGFRWNDTMTNYYGEVHGGVENFEEEFSMLSVGSYYNIEITGKNENGESVRIIAKPDMMGRQMCQKFVDGRLTRANSEDVDMDKRDTLVLEDDTDVITYEKIN